MDVLGDLVSPDRGGDALWIHRPGPRSRSWSGDQFSVDAWKAGNLLRHYGVREGAAVGIIGAIDEADPPSPQALIGLFGAWILGAGVRLEPAETEGIDVLVGPSEALDHRELTPGCKAMGFGDSPEDPTVVHFEGERWSENPVRFPAEVGPVDTALLTDDGPRSHADVLGIAAEMIEAYGITSSDRVALTASLSEPRTVIAGVVAPLLAGATITLGEEATLVVAEQDGENVIRPSSV